MTEPEIKRKRIGAEFIAVFEDEANALRRRRAAWTGWCRARSIPT